MTADPATNSLVIQASQEGYATIAGVIEKLDIERPQVLVEALIMEVDVTDGTELGFNGLFRADQRRHRHHDRAGRRTARRRPRSAAAGRRRRRRRALPLVAELLPTDLRRRRGRQRRPRTARLIQGIIRAAAVGRRHQHHLRAAHPHLGQRGGGDPRRQQHPDHHQPRAGADHGGTADGVGPLDLRQRRAPGHRRDAARDAADHRGRQPAPRHLPGDHRHQQGAASRTSATSTRSASRSPAARSRTRWWWATARRS